MSWMLRRFKFILMITCTGTFALANHGPGASGGGAFTVSGETLKPGHFEFSLREDFSDFEHFDKADAIQRAKVGGDFDALDHGFITTADLSFGVTENLQIGASIGYFIGHDFISAVQEDDGSVSTGTTNPDGLTDLALTAKYRLLHGWPGNLAIICGVIIPTGRDE